MALYHTHKANDPHAGLAKLLAAVDLKEDESTEVTEKDVQAFIAQYYPSWTVDEEFNTIMKEATSRKDEDRRLIEHSIAHDPWNPLFDHRAAREAINSDTVAKVRKQEELLELESRMKSNPSAYSAPQWTRLRLQKRLYFNEKKTIQ